MLSSFWPSKRLRLSGAASCASADRTQEQTVASGGSVISADAGSRATGRASALTAAEIADARAAIDARRRC